ncbi:MAG: peptidylprolyl isomerase [Sediminibacterium sp.]|jgi:FKBP-type peptidyl-prolyl cis-trans isomerase FkpA|nr:MAG: peptidylprolyl isomerase [Sediminibacterium sp.]
MNHFTSKNTKKTSFLVIIASFLAIFAIFSNTACSKSSASESDQMISYAKSNNITYISDPSGILYEIITPGNSTHPTINNTITVTYVGTLMNGKQFDAGTITYALSNLIPGWQIAVPKIGIGGEIKVLIPSSLGYGSRGSGSIPGNSPLYFDIKLSAVK